MQIYQERRKIHRFLRSRPVFIFLSILACVLLVVSLRMSVRAYQALRAREEAELEYQRLLTQKERLDEKIGDLQNQEALEREAKKRFNITAPGEKVLIIVERDASASMIAKPPYMKAWEFIKNLFR